MLVLITYDVNTETPPAASACARWPSAASTMASGCRIRSFECDLDAAQYKLVQAKLLKLIDPETDSLRFYNLGDRYAGRIEHFGVRPGYDPEGTLLL
jgi:CRISPR-associated protein Cas2